MALVFDFDGVIVDSRVDNILAINKFAKKYGFDPMDDAAYAGMLTCNFYDYWHMMLGKQAQGFLQDLHHLQRPIPEVLPGMREILLEYRPAIVSSNYGPLIRKCLVAHNIDLEIYGADVDKSKVVKLNRLKKIPDVFVTDTAGDVIEGKQAGYVMVAVTWGFNTVEQLQQSGAHHIVDTPEQLQELLLQLLHVQEILVTR